MSKETKSQSSNIKKDDAVAEMARVQNLLDAVQRGLGGAQDKYDVLEAKCKEQEQELAETKTENLKLKKKLQKLKAKLEATETVQQDGDKNEETAVAPSFVKDKADVSGEMTARIKELYTNTASRLPPKLIRGKNENPCAFCVLVMNRDAYALGAAVLAHRLKKLNSKADIVCMVTRDVSLGVLEALASEFDAIFQVPYLEYRCRKMTTKKQQNYYGHWIEKSFTKWNALALTMYKKVVLLDADILPVSNIDQLFELSAPAATFSSPWAKPYKKEGYPDPYKGLRHGDLVDSARIREAVELSLCHAERATNKGSYVALGSVVLLEPSMESYNIFNAFVCSQQPFGIPGCHSGFDEQSIILFYYLQQSDKQWTHISQGFNALSWHEQWLEGCDVKCYHYFNAKPWEMRPDTYPDLKMWYQAVEELNIANSHDCGYLIEVCMSDKSFIDIFRKMTTQKENVKEIANCDTSRLKPVLPNDGGFDDSETSSPRNGDKTLQTKQSIESTATAKLKSFSTSSDENASDPPKVEGAKYEKAPSVSSDGGKSSKHSETASIRSGQSNRSAPYPPKRTTWYDDFGPVPSKDIDRVRDSTFEARHGVRSPAIPITSEDYANIYAKDGRLRRGTRPEHDMRPATSDPRRMRRYETTRDYHTDLSRQPRFYGDHLYNASRRRSSNGYGSDRIIDRVSRHHAMSHSPVNPRSLTRFESFGSSTSSGSSLRMTPKHEHRRQRY